MYDSINMDSFSSLLRQVFHHDEKLVDRLGMTDVSPWNKRERQDNEQNPSLDALEIVSKFDDCSQHLQIRLCCHLCSYGDEPDLSGDQHRTIEYNFTSRAS